MEKQKTPSPIFIKLLINKHKVEKIESVIEFKENLKLKPLSSTIK